MSQFIVSARKYRPARLDEVVGQEHVSQTLKNALANDHLAHAFLFCGPRGVGKTTCARILAKVLNCTNVTADHEPCGVCPSCTAFDKSASFNIVELDAASNNSVEHIRQLTEQVRFQPQQGQYKVFIIDEVHMLSTAAFNAFLKTLEEPPSYAVFILATTEKHKILPTILSRCQIFDFRRIQAERTVAHLRGICQQEGITADPEALHIIAQKADGALRDALSIFDRIVSFSGKSISYQDVIDNLNVLDYDYFFRFTDALLDEDRAGVLNIFDEILRKGFEADIFVNGLAEHLRNLLVCKDAATLALLATSEKLRARYQQQARLAPAAFLLTALDLAADCDVHYKMARHKRLHTELYLLKMCYAGRALQSPGLAVAIPGDATAPAAAPQKKSEAVETTQAVTTEPAPEYVTPAPPEDPPVAPPPAVAEVSPTPPAAPPAPVEEVAPVSVPRAKNSLIGGSLNLAALAESLDEDEEEGDDPDQCTQENLESTWADYCATIESPSVRQMLIGAKLRLDEQTVHVEVASPMAKGAVQAERDLMMALRQGLGCRELRWEITVDASQLKAAAKPKRPTSDRDKFIAMREVNPLLDEMRKRLDLRPDHR